MRAIRAITTLMIIAVSSTKDQITVFLHEAGT